MNNRQLKWKIGNNDLKSATMMIEYYNTDGKTGDIIAVPLGNLKPATLLTLQRVKISLMRTVSRPTRTAGQKVASLMVKSIPKSNPSRHSN